MGTLADTDAAPSWVASRPNLSTCLPHLVLSLIRDRNLQSGDRLPSAKAPAEQFAVATPTMREALRRLQATGVIDIRHRSGIYVRLDQERLMVSNPAYGVLETQTILQVLDARLLIEPHPAELAARWAGGGGDCRDYASPGAGGEGAGETGRRIAPRQQRVPYGDCPRLGVSGAGPRGGISDRGVFNRVARRADDLAGGDSRPRSPESPVDLRGDPGRERSASTRSDGPPHRRGAGNGGAARGVTAGYAKSIATAT